MGRSTFEQQLPDDWKPQAAIGHDSNGKPLEERWRIYPEMAAAGLWTTASDLGRVVIELQQSLKGRSNRLFPADLRARMLTGSARREALGFSAWGEGTSAVFSHGGANNGFRAMLYAYAHTGRAAIVMANGDGGDALLIEILRSIAREYGWPDYQPTEKTAVPLDEANAVQYAGRYDVLEGDIDVMYARDGQGRVTSLEVHALGATVLARRVD